MLAKKKAKEKDRTIAYLQSRLVMQFGNQRTMKTTQQEEGARKDPGADSPTSLPCGLAVIL